MVGVGVGVLGAMVGATLGDGTTLGNVGEGVCGNACRPCIANGANDGVTLG
jgi:hypothetical protein